MRHAKSLGALSQRRISNPRLDDADVHAWPTCAAAYELLEECGRGVSATVYRARCKDCGRIVAIKALDLESLSSPLEDIMHEAQTMKAYKHDAILPLYCSFVTGEQLWMVMPFMEGGSVAHIMRYRHPEGLQEAVVATIMREVLRALAYVHTHGSIHRDVKAGNVLVDGEGRVKLGDFGVSATLEREGDWGGHTKARQTFVGTPCWMAPEVLEQAASGYGSPADIWSFGITLLEMAHGHAPFSKLPPMKVLLMTLQGPPPQLEERCGARHFSRGMREVVARCLNKEPSKRPSARELLEHRFFKRARDAEFLKRMLLMDLPSLPQRVSEIRAGKAATQARQNDRDMLASQISYIADVAQWDFACCKDTQLQQPASGRGSDSGPQSPEAAAVAPSDAAATAAAGLTVVPTPAATRDQHDRSATIRSYACYPDGSSSSSSSNNGNSGNQQMLLLSPQPDAAAHLSDHLVPADQHECRKGSSSSGGGGGAGVGITSKDLAVKTPVAPAAAAAAAPASPCLACFAGGREVAAIPTAEDFSLPNTPNASPPGSRPHTPAAALGTVLLCPSSFCTAGVAGDGQCAVGVAAMPEGMTKLKGRFAVVEAAGRYQGPELLLTHGSGSSKRSTSSSSCCHQNQQHQQHQQQRHAAAAVISECSSPLARQRSVSSPDVLSMSISATGTGSSFSKATVDPGSTQTGLLLLHQPALMPAPFFTPQTPMQGVPSPAAGEAAAAAAAAAPVQSLQQELQQQKQQLSTSTTHEPVAPPPFSTTLAAPRAAAAGAAAAASSSLASLAHRGSSNSSWRSGELGVWDTVKGVCTDLAHHIRQASPHAHRHHGGARLGPPGGGGGGGGDSSSSPAGIRLTGRGGGSAADAATATASTATTNAAALSPFMLGTGGSGLSCTAKPGNADDAAAAAAVSETVCVIDSAEQSRSLGQQQDKWLQSGELSFKHQLEVYELQGQELKGQELPAAPISGSATAPGLAAQLPVDGSSSCARTHRLPFSSHDGAAAAAAAGGVCCHGDGDGSSTPRLQVSFSEGAKSPGGSVVTHKGRFTITET